jgi:hypothetical protein
MNSVKSPSDVRATGTSFFVKKESSHHFQQHYILYEDTAYLERRTTKELPGSHRQTPTLKIKAGSQAVSFMHSISSHPEISSSIARHLLPTTCPRRTAGRIYYDTLVVL